MSNVVSSFFQCYPNSSSLGRSVIQETSGGKTLLIGGFSSIVLGSVIIVLTPLLQSLPMTCLASIIIVNLKGFLFQVKDFVFYFHINLFECVNRKKIKQKEIFYLFYKRFYGQLHLFPLFCLMLILVYIWVSLHHLLLIQ
jgi:hypothetical protein